MRCKSFSSLLADGHKVEKLYHLFRCSLYSSWSDMINNFRGVMRFRRTNERRREGQTELQLISANRVNKRIRC